MAAGGSWRRNVHFPPRAPRCRAHPGHSRHPAGPSAPLLLRICAKWERPRRQRPEQTRKTALLCSAREPTVGAAALPRRGLGRLPSASAAPPRPPPEVGRAAPAGGGERAARESTLHSAPLRVCALLPAGRSALLCLSMEGARSPSPREDLELLALGRGQPDEQKPLNGTVQVIPLSVEEPCPAQVRPAWPRGGRCPRADSEPGCRPGPGPGTLRVAGFQPTLRASRTQSAGASWNLRNGADVGVRVRGSARPPEPARAPETPLSL